MPSIPGIRALVLVGSTLTPGVDPIGILDESLMEMRASLAERGEDANPTLAEWDRLTRQYTTALDTVRARRIPDPRVAAVLADYEILREYVLAPVSERDFEIILDPLRQRRDEHMRTLLIDLARKGDYARIAEVVAEIDADSLLSTSPEVNADKAIGRGSKRPASASPASSAGEPQESIEVTVAPEGKQTKKTTKKDTRSK